MDKALQTMVDNIPKKTGKKLEEWIQILATANFDKHGVAVKYLKTEYGVTHGFANTIVTLAKDDGTSSKELVNSQYKGRETLLPLYEKLVATIEGFGNDVVITPKKSSVSLIRKRQFAVIKPATQTRIDLGLKLKDIEVQHRLEGSGPFGTMCTHRIQIRTINDIDDEVVKWLLLAYEKSI
jgi:hypothetical protein